MKDGVSHRLLTVRSAQSLARLNVAGRPKQEGEMNDRIPVPILAGAAAAQAGRGARPKRRRLSLFRLIGAEPATISEINTTPLIDVMLVLLIMFIITIPAATHKVPLDLPRPAPVTEQRLFHQLDIAANGS